MHLLMIALLASVPTLEVETQTEHPNSSASQAGPVSPMVADELNRRIEALLVAVGSEDAGEIDTAAMQLLEYTDLLTIPIAQLGEETMVAELYGLLGWAFWTVDKIEEADDAFERAGSAMAQEYGYLSFRHDLAWEQRDWPKVLDIVEADVIISQPGEAIAHHYSASAIHTLRRGLDYGEANGRVAEVLIAVGWGDYLPPGELGWVYLFALKKRHREGDEQGVRDLLSRMRNPTYIVDIFRYEYLAGYRAQVEEQHGADLGIAASTIEADLALLWDERQEDSRYLLSYLVSLRNLGRWQEISDRFGPIVDRFQRAIEAGETEHYLQNSDGFFVVNYLADAELRLDRYQLAIGRMDSILGLGLEENPDLINQAINRLEMLMQQGDYAETLSSARELEQVGDQIIAPYGRMLVRSGAACAAHLGGDQQQASEWLNRLTEGDEPFKIVYFETLLCLEESDAALEFVMENLRDHPTGNIYWYFQERALWEPRGDYDRMIKERADAILALPEVREAIEAAGGIRRFALAHLSA